jgi:hypothetical protein
MAFICLLLQPSPVFPSQYRCHCPFSERVTSYHDDREGRFLLKVDADVRKYTASCPRRLNVHSYGRDKYKSNNIILYNFQIENKVYAYFTLLKNST